MNNKCHVYWLNFKSGRTFSPIRSYLFLLLYSAFQKLQLKKKKNQYLPSTFLSSILAMTSPPTPIRQTETAIICTMRKRTPSTRQLNAKATGMATHPKS